MAEAYRRQGLARRLVEALRAWFAEQGAEKTVLTAAVGNPQALGFWRGVGFEEVMVRMWKGTG